jgi:hypothetical protein
VTSSEFSAGKELGFKPPTSAGFKSPVIIPPALAEGEIDSPKSRPAGFPARPIGFDVCMARLLNHGPQFERVTLGVEEIENVTSLTPSPDADAVSQNLHDVPLLSPPGRDAQLSQTLAMS